MKKKKKLSTNYDSISDSHSSLSNADSPKSNSSIGTEQISGTSINIPEEQFSATSINIPDQVFQSNTDKIDFVLVFDRVRDNEYKKVIRRSYQKNLQALGLKLETSRGTCTDFSYVRITTPFNVLVKGAELLKLKKPIKTSLPHQQGSFKDFGSCWKRKKRIRDPNFTISQVMKAKRFKDFVLEENYDLFSDCERLYITYILLTKAIYSDQIHIRAGINNLLANGVYIDAYPLHQLLATKNTFNANILQNERNILINNWASLKNIVSQQPINMIKDYCGDKAAFFFAWMETYTAMLFPATLIGLSTFIYGIIYSNFASTEVKYICDPLNYPGKYVICPQCDSICNYTLYSDGCMIAKITALFDHEMIIVCSILICLWGIAFNGLWIRKQNILKHRWNIANFEEIEEIRPEYLSKITTSKTNIFTGERELHMSFKQKVLRYSASISLILFLLCIVLATTFGIIVYRLTIKYSFSHLTDEGQITSYANYITIFTAAVINSIALNVFEFIYNMVAKVLTDYEIQKTERDYQKSYTLKMIVFHFINYYASIIYVAFFKGKFVDRPGRSSWYLFGDYRQDNCSNFGCFSDVTIQLSIVMIFKQIFNNVIEITKLTIQRKLRSRKLKGRDNCSAWELDMVLMKHQSIVLFSDYLEMTIQYGFVIMFVSAFPLAPLFALLNSLIMIRKGAYKMLFFRRRSADVRADGIGIWAEVIHYFTYIGIVTNAFIIAWTSNFIPRAVFLIKYSTNGFIGYAEWSFGVFNTSNFAAGQRPNPELFPKSVNVTECRYRMFSIPINEVEQSHAFMYWEIFSFRWIFVLIFQYVCFLLMNLLHIVPLKPEEIKAAEKYERYVSTNDEVEYLFKKYKVQTTRMRRNAVSKQRSSTTMLTH